MTIESKTPPNVDTTYTVAGTTSYASLANYNDKFVFWSGGRELHEYGVPKNPN